MLSPRQTNVFAQLLFRAGRLVDPSCPHSQTLVFVTSTQSDCCRHRALFSSPTHNSVLILKDSVTDTEPCLSRAPGVSTYEVSSVYYALFAA